ncbi:rho guanine nucleotide exchange factor 15 isoform X2 [Ambystoma mexicanum]|uniref:rho guanine nucleotide exchange factor 15 isoform X2 n=1 Tax=Ambystoma mexicanum TaxID=8296 RepID=UPI0037E99637
MTSAVAPLSNQYNRASQPGRPCSYRTSLIQLLSYKYNPRVPPGQHCPSATSTALLLREEQPVAGHLNHSAGSHVNVQNVPACQRDCPCSCHATRPGMVMVWVPETDVHVTSLEEDVATLSDSSSSADESPPFRQVFVVNREATKTTKRITDEDVNGNVAGDIPDAKSRTSKATMALLSKKPFGGSYPIRRHSLTSATGMTNGMKNPGMTNGHHDSSTPEGSSGGNVVLTSYRTMPDSSFSDEEAFTSAADCECGSSDSTPSSDALQEPLCEPAPASIRKPPRKSKLGSQTSQENEVVPPTVPPKAPRKPPRTPQAPLPFFRKGSLKKQLQRDILEEEPPAVTDRHLHRHVAVKVHRGRPSSSCSSQEQKEDFDDSSLDETSTGDYEVQARDKARVCFDGVPATDSTAITSPKSIDWESRLQDEPLYQTYRQTVIRKEIKRQAVPRNCSITSFDVNTESSPTSSEYGGNSPRSRRSITPQNTLWQELPAVRESGILEKMSMDERKMQESMFEVLTSEASYRRSLSVLTEHFMESRELDDTIIIREKKILFSNILKVKEVSERFLKDLEERVDESLYITDICDIIYEHAQQSFLVYIDYVRNQVYQEKTYSSLMERNVQFATVIARLQELPQCQRLPFMSFLLLPFQRITRIKMLIENILKRSEEGSIREQNALKALESVSKIIEECNSEVGRMKQMEELILITKTIEFDKTKAVPIISQARYLEKQGELSEYIQKGSLFSIKPKFTPVYFFLFNDFLLITHRKSSERHVVVDYAHRSLVQVQDCVDSAYGSTMENGFFLTLLENHQGKTCDRLFKAPTQSDMHRWMGAFPNKKEPKQSSDETIYEDWDCPQVQCVEAYTATQADELSLEPTDIINILRKTTEGWYEGIRLSDGKKGWFPSKYVQEITNEHVRRRNLRERYRVLQAARQIQTMPYDPKKKYCST